MSQKNQIQQNGIVPALALVQELGVEGRPVLGGPDLGQSRIPNAPALAPVRRIGVELPEFQTTLVKFHYRLMFYLAAPTQKKPLVLCTSRRDKM